MRISRRHLKKGIPLPTLKSYLNFVRRWVSEEPLVHIDDSDVVKPDGFKFEDLGLVKDGSKNTDTKNVYEKGYHVTGSCVLTNSNPPVSIFFQIHSSREKDFTFINDIPFSAMERGAALLGKATFVTLAYKGKSHDAYLSHVKVQSTDSRKDIYLFQFENFRVRKLAAINALNFFFPCAWHF